MSEQLVEQIGRAICKVRNGHMRGYLAYKVGYDREARAILPLIEAAKVEGVRLGIEAAAKKSEQVGQCANTSGRGQCCETLGEDIADSIRALDPKQIAGGSDAD